MSGKELQKPIVNNISIAQNTELLSVVQGSSELQKATYLEQFAGDLLAECGVDAAINGRPSVVTKYACEVDASTDELSKTYYARVAQYKNHPSPFIVFGEDDSSKKVVARNPQAITFSNLGEEAMLNVQNGLDVSVNSTNHLAIVNNILETIGTKYADEKMTASERRAERARKIGGATKSVIEGFKSIPHKIERDWNDTYSNNISRKAITTVVGLGVLYGPQIAAGHADAKLFGIPMPQPIELLVDINNAPDHKAQAFDAPQGAAEVHVGQDITDIPMLTGYSTAGAPDASFNSSAIGYQFDESRPGLYESDFNAADRNSAYYPATDGQDRGNQKSADFGDDGCYTVLGDYADGKTVVFTQTAGLDGKIKVKAVNQRELQVCLTNPSDANAKGSVFIYQNH